jgi:Kef-type K+ transport system, predicted NAD-binding component
MHDALILTLATGFSLALVFGYLTQKLKLSPILGYLLAGIVVSPFTPGPVADSGIANQLAEVGVILLMFGVGLHFHVKDLWDVRKIALPGAIVQSLLATALGTLVAHLFGWPWTQGLILGIAVSVASTVVLVRVLSDNDLVATEKGHIAIGWLIVEDLFTVVVLVLLPAIASSSGAGSAAGAAASGGTLAILASVGIALLKIGALAVLVLVVGGRLIPWLLAKVARTRSRELFTLSVLAVALAIAVIAATAFGASMALGAFLAGMVVGQSKMSEQAAADALPLKDAFAVIFFVSVGMLFNPALVLQHWALFLAVMGIILVAKPLGALFIVLVLGRPVSTALAVAAGLAQIGEFSFILASESSRLGLLPAEGSSIIVAAALVSIGLNPLIFKETMRLESALRGHKRLWRKLNRAAEAKGSALNYETAPRLRSREASRAIVVGYGPVGQTAVKLLAGFGVESVVVDLNVDSVARITAQGGLAVYGDAGKADILAAAGIDRARYLVVTLPDLGSRLPVIVAARQINAEIKVFSRAHYLGERETLEELGVTEVCYEEAEAAAGLARLILEEEGADESRAAAAVAELREELALRRKGPGA